MARPRLGPRLRGAAQLAVSQAAFVVSGYALNLVLGRRLGPVEFGLYSVVITVMGVVNLAQTQGVPQALARAVAAEPAAEAAAWRTAVALQRVASAAGTVLLIVLAPVAAWLLDDRSLGTGLLVAAAAVPGYAALATWTGYLNGRHAFRRQASLLTWYSALRIVVVLGLAWLLGVHGAIAGFAVVPLLVVALLVRRPAALASAGPRAPWRPLARFSLASIGFSLAVTGVMSVDLLLVRGLVDDPAETGVYAAAQNAARVTYYALLPAGAVLFPAMAATLAAGDAVQRRALVTDGVEGALAVVLPLVAVLAAAGGPLLELGFGAPYAGGGAALVFLAPALGALALAATVASLVRGAGSARGPLVAAALALAAALAAGVPLTAIAGPEGAAAATLLASLLLCAAQLALLHRRVPFRLEPTRLARLALAALAALAVARLGEAPLAAVAASAGAALVYVVLVVALRVTPRALVRRAR